LIQPKLANQSPTEKCSIIFNVTPPYNHAHSTEFWFLLAWPTGIND